MKVVLIFSYLDSQKWRGCFEPVLESQSRPGMQTSITEHADGLLSVPGVPGPPEEGQGIYSGLTITPTSLGASATLEIALIFAPPYAFFGSHPCSLPIHYLILKSCLLLTALGKD